jgi:hypothetical protein
MIITTTILIILLTLLNTYLFINSYLLQHRLEQSNTTNISLTTNSSMTPRIQLRRIKSINAISITTNNFVFSFSDSKDVPGKYVYFVYKSNVFRILKRTSSSLTSELLIGDVDSITLNSTNSSSAFLFFA